MMRIFPLGNLVARRASYTATVLSAPGFGSSLPGQETGGLVLALPRSGSVRQTFKPVLNTLFRSEEFYSTDIIPIR